MLLGWIPHSTSVWDPLPRWDPTHRIPRAPGVPPLDERYVGYGKNKVQWVQHLRSLGFEFWVLPRGYLMHCPHAMSRAGRSWQRNRDNHKERMDELFQAQLAEQQASERSAPQSAGCRRPIGTCSVPLTQLTDPLDARLVGRRRPASIEG